MPSAGVPAMLAVVPPEKVTPDGRLPELTMFGAGSPLAVTGKVPANPTVNVALFALVMAGALPKV